MNGLLNQVVFDAKRKYLRNKAFVFFNLLMPVGFYLLFTKVVGHGMPSGFAKQYAASMITYSILITQIFTLARSLVEDRENKFQRFYSLVPAKITNYFISISIVVSAMTITSAILVQLIAIMVNKVDISSSAFVSTCIVALIGQLPLLIFGFIIGSIVRGKNIDVVSNLLLFPLAIVSGLWMPLNTFPTLAQKIGQHLPTYALGQLINNAMTQTKFAESNIVNLIIWTVILMVVLSVITLKRRTIKIE